MYFTVWESFSCFFINSRWAFRYTTVSNGLDWCAAVVALTHPRMLVFMILLYCIRCETANVVNNALIVPLLSDLHHECRHICYLAFVRKTVSRYQWYQNCFVFDIGQGLHSLQSQILYTPARLQIDKIYAIISAFKFYRQAVFKLHYVLSLTAQSINNQK